MLILFQRKKLQTSTVQAVAEPQAPKGLTRPEPAASLLATPRRQKLLEHIWQRTSLSRKQFAMLYRAPLERYAEMVQQFPASESHHHAYLGGMLDHGLEIVAFALKLRQSHLLPAGATPEDQAAQSEAWTAAVAYAALLHDLGKIAVDLHVEYGDGTIWHPWHGPVQRPYRFRYREDREYRLHGAATGLLYHRLLDPGILDWLSEYPALWAPLLYVLAGQYEHAGVLGELVVQADRASVAQELGGDPARAMAAPKHALQRKLIDGLRYLLKEELKLNQPEASDGWLTQDALWLVSKTVCDKLRAHLLSLGVEGIPASNTAVFNVLQDHGMLQRTPDGKAIWRATISSAGGWSHSFTLLRLAPALIWEGSERPAPFEGTVFVAKEDTSTQVETPAPTVPVPASTAAPFPMAKEASPSAVQLGDGVDTLLELLGTHIARAAELPPPAALSSMHSEAGALRSVDIQPATVATSAPVSMMPCGDHFIGWLKCGIQSRRLIINDAKALVHTVADTAYLVSPGVFQRYAQEHPHVMPLAKQDQLSDWQWVQKQFEKLRLHRKQDSGLNIWPCEVIGPRKSRRLYGYLLNDPGVLFDQLLPNNPYLAL